MAANCIAMSLRHGMDFSIPNISSHNFWNPVYLPHLHKEYDRSLPTVTINENQFHFEPIHWDRSWEDKNIMLNGYWQSYKYFHEYRNKLLDLFNYPWHCIDDTCSIHARYGDYLTIPGKHILLTQEYLEVAMDMVIKEKGIRKFKVFSDSIPDFNLRFGKLYDFEYSTNINIEQDLIEISSCSSNIGSSSTFSFWAAYLNRNPDKMVIQQSVWFQDGWKDEYGRLVDTKDVLLPEWIKL
jgi:hypothetical protein